MFFQLSASSKCVRTYVGSPFENNRLYVPFVRCVEVCESMILSTNYVVGKLMVLGVGYLLVRTFPYLLNNLRVRRHVGPLPSKKVRIHSYVMLYVELKKSFRPAEEYAPRWAYRFGRYHVRTCTGVQYAMVHLDRDVP
jgi:hypothetical protein